MITRFYTYTLTLTAPLLTTALEGDPNSVRSLRFIPGSAIRGAVAGNLAPDNDSALFRTLILSGQVCYLNAYPAINAGRTLPTPVSFRMEKYQDEYHDLAQYEGDPNATIDPGTAWPTEQLKRLPAPFLSLDRADLRTGSTSVESRVHQQRYRPKGRAYTHTDPQTKTTEERGTIFTYEALEAGQEFRGALAITGHEVQDITAVWEQIRALLGETVYLGRSRRAQYGGAVRISDWSAPSDREAEGRRRLITRDLREGERFQAFLSADYIGRNLATGQLDPTWFTEELTNRLGGIDKVRIYWPRWAFHTAGGYNRKWGLPLPQTLALSAGSVVVLEALQPIAFTDLLAIEHAGFGERRAEGFGRVIFLDPPRQPPALVLKEPPSQQELPTVSVPPLLREMERRMLVDAVERKMTEVATQIAGSARLERIPSPSLLSRLRVPLRGSPADALTILRQWLDEDSSQHLRRPAMRQLSECWVQGQPLVRWLEQVVNPSGDRDKETLPLSDIAQKRYIQSPQEAEKQLQEPEILIKLRVRLIDEVLALLARRKRLDERGKAHAAQL